MADIPADDLTHLIYAFAKIDSSGRMSLFDPYAAVEKTFQANESVDGVADTWDQDLAGNFNQLAELKAVNPELKNLIAVGGWTLSGPFSDVASTAEGRANFADSAVEFLKTYDMFDGLDFDWEYPGGGGLESNKVRPEDGENYALLLEAVRERLDELEAETGREYEISVASPAGSDKIVNFNLEGLAPYVDFFNLMAYDFHGGWENITGHQAPMYDTIGGDYDIVTAVNLYKEAGIDPGKIVLGAPAYTRAWAGVQDSDGDGGWQEVTNQLAPGSFERGVYDYKDVVQKVLDPNSDWKIYWDDDAQAAYVFSESEGIYSTFETPTSIALKSQWAQSEGLGGIMFWDLSGDVSQGPESLTNAAFRSWYGGETVEQISATSALQVDVVVGGNGLMDSFVDYVYEPPIALPGEDDPVFDSPEQPGDDALAGFDIGEVFTINWSWGSEQVLDFDPQADKLDFGWIGGDAFTLSEQDGSVVIEIASNQQSYVLQDVSAADLSMQNIQALDVSAAEQWSAFLG
ncbi:MAG: glycoside hydrolase family 18 protein [Burkholderiaceae bacterium]|nr:glycoside hydrolase family 18 protein [Burkholderiaceae bacterium]